MKTITIKNEATISVETDAALLDGTNIEQAIADFNEAKKLIKELEAQKSAAETRIRELMGTAQVGLVAGVERVKIAERTRTNINTEILKEAFPEAYTQCAQAKTYTVVTAVS